MRWCVEFKIYIPAVLSPKIQMSIISISADSYLRPVSVTTIQPYTAMRFDIYKITYISGTDIKILISILLQIINPRPDYLPAPIHLVNTDPYKTIAIIIYRKFSPEFPINCHTTAGTAQSKQTVFYIQIFPVCKTTITSAIIDKPKMRTRFDCYDPAPGGIYNKCSSL